MPRFGARSLRFGRSGSAGRANIHTAVFLVAIRAGEDFGMPRAVVDGADLYFEERGGGVPVLCFPGALGTVPAL